jgi:Na+/melibiose symporter-like transporter
VKREERSFSPQRHRRQTRARLILGGMLVLLVVGGGLVWLFYGRTAALTAVLCLLGAAAIMALLWLILTLLERWVKDEEP